MKQKPVWLEITSKSQETQGFLYLFDQKETGIYDSDIQSVDPGATEWV